MTASYLTREPSILRDAYRRLDFTRREDCLDATRGQDAVVISAAHVTGVHGMERSPTANLLPNLQIAAGLLEAAALNEVERVVLISSSTVYHLAYHPLREEEYDRNRPPYPLYAGVGWMYRYLEELASHYHRLGRLKVGIVRTTNIYGPFDRFDEHAHVLPALIRRAHRRERPFVVWGTPHVTRDFHFVDDFVDDLLLVLDSRLDADPVNSANGAAVTIGEAADAVLAACGHDERPLFDASRPTAIPYRTLDTSKMDALFGVRRRTTLGEGLRRTVEWYRRAAAEPSDGPDRGAAEAGR